MNFGFADWPRGFREDFLKVLTIPANRPGSHLGLVTRTTNLDSLFQMMFHMNFGFVDWP